MPYLSDSPRLGSIITAVILVPLAQLLVGGH